MLGLGRFKESLKRLKCANTGHSPVGSGPDYSLPNRPIAKLDTPQRLSDHPAKPRDVRAMDVGGWLRGLGLGQYEEKFQDNTIDAALVPRPTVMISRISTFLLSAIRIRPPDPIAVTAGAGRPADVPAFPTKSPRDQKRELVALFGAEGRELPGA
jgi:SAM domain (Sterile alpha motif)